jgi:hypothetical protein
MGDLVGDFDPKMLHFIEKLGDPPGNFNQKKYVFTFFYYK